MKSYDVTIQSSLPCSTYTWCYLFFKILENEIWKFGRILLFVKFSSERVNSRLCRELRETEDIRGRQFVRGVLLLASPTVRRAGMRVEPLRSSAWEAIL